MAACDAFYDTSCWRHSLARIVRQLCQHDAAHRFSQRQVATYVTVTICTFVTQHTRAHIYIQHTHWHVFFSGKQVSLQQSKVVSTSLLDIGTIFWIRRNILINLLSGTTWENQRTGMSYVQRMDVSSALVLFVRMCVVCMRCVRCVNDGLWHCCTVLLCIMWLTILVLFFFCLFLCVYVLCAFQVLRYYNHADERRRSVSTPIARLWHCWNAQHYLCEKQQRFRLETLQDELDWFETSKKVHGIYYFWQLFFFVSFSLCFF